MSSILLWLPLILNLLAWVLFFLFLQHFNDKRLLPEHKRHEEQCFIKIGRHRFSGGSLRHWRSTSSWTASNAPQITTARSVTRVVILEVESV